MRIRIGLAVAVLAAAAAAWGTSPTVGRAAQEGATCTLAGSANLNPGLSTSSQSFQYAFSGTMSGCQSTDSTLTSGTVFAGSPSGTLTGSGPFPSGSGSCGSSTTSGVAVVQWNNAKTTVVSYTTSGGGAEVALQGQVIPSTVVNGVTYTTSEFSSGESTLAELVFSIPTGSSENCATVPVTTANINGQTGLGSAQ
jgi:hypothetical protein